VHLEDEIFDSPPPSKSEGPGFVESVTHNENHFIFVVVAVAVVAVVALDAVVAVSCCCCLPLQDVCTLLQYTLFKRNNTAIFIAIS
jgi:hypothetical protein